MCAVLLRLQVLKSALLLSNLLVFGLDGSAQVQILLIHLAMSEFLSAQKFFSLRDLLTGVFVLLSDMPRFRHQLLYLRRLVAYGTGSFLFFWRFWIWLDF